MAKIRTQRETLAYYAEESLGQVPESPSGAWIVPSSEGLERSSESAVFHASRDSLMSAWSVSHLKVAGEIRMKLAPDLYFDLLKAALRGKVVTSGSGPYEHQMIPSSRDYSFTFERHVPDVAKYLRYIGCRIVGAMITFPRSGFIEVTYRVLGCNEVEADNPLGETLERSSEPPYGAEESLLYIESIEEPTFIEGSLSIEVASSIGRFSPVTQVAEEVWAGIVRTRTRVTLFAEDLDRLSTLAEQATQSIELVLERGGYQVACLMESSGMLSASPPFISSRSCYAQTIELEGEGPSVEVIVTNNQSTV